MENYMKIYELTTTEITYETEMRLGELSAEIELWTEKNNREKLAACEKELAEILAGIENGQKFYEALIAEIKAYNAAHA